MTDTRTAASAPAGNADEGSPFPEMARERLYALRRMKAIAGGLLLVALVAYVIARVVGDGHGWWGYLQAAAEASMVGGLADWFAVTALFRRPLGLPIPHTAIIPSKKDQIGEGLATFVQQYFLTTEILSERVEAAKVPQRVGEWLADPEHAHRLAQVLSNSISGLAGMLREDQLRDSVATFADKRLRELEIAPLLSRLIDAICDSGQHQAALTSVLRGLRRFLDDNRSLLRTRVADESPESAPSDVPTDADMLRVRMTAATARAFAKRALRVVAAGRPPCPLCGNPLDPEGHICPRQNGHLHAG